MGEGFAKYLRGEHSGQAPRKTGLLFRKNSWGLRGSDSMSRGESHFLLSGAHKVETPAATWKKGMVVGKLILNLHADSKHGVLVRILVTNQ